MKYRHLGKQGLRVSELALGSWMTDVSADDKQDLAAQSIQLAYEKGINFFDCADAYSGGAAERFLGKTLAQFPVKNWFCLVKSFSPREQALTIGDYRVSTSRNRSINL